MSDFVEDIRYGGALNEAEGEDAIRKAEERERKKAEVRKRLEEGQKKAKKGFLTPERKKKLRKLLMIKAAEDLKRQQLLVEQQRIKALQERTIPLPNVDSIDDKAQLEAIYNKLHAHLVNLEEEKYDINFLTSQMETTINALNIEVNDLRGKFVKPSLKKVSKYDNKFKKMAESKEKDNKNFRNNLKNVKKESVSTILANSKKSDKPVWSKKNKEEKKEEVVSEPVAEAVEDDVEASEEEEEADEE